MNHGIAQAVVPYSRPRRRPTVTICGSFRRNPPRLKDEYRRFETLGCEVLSPKDISFVADRDGFVFAEHETDLSPIDIERAHLRAMQRSDFVWLHAPAGYVGLSAAMEIGFAAAQGIPLFSGSEIKDVTVRELVQMVDSPERALAEFMRKTPDASARGLSGLQAYYERVALDRGWSKESPEQCLTLLTGEIEELREALLEFARERPGVPSASSHVASEMADVQLYLVHLSNALGVDLSCAVIAKEHVNAARFEIREQNAA